MISGISESGRQEFNPTADRVLHDQDTLLLVCREGGLERIAALKEVVHCRVPPHPRHRAPSVQEKR